MSWLARFFVQLTVTESRFTSLPELPPVAHILTCIAAADEWLGAKISLAMAYACGVYAAHEIESGLHVGRYRVGGLPAGCCDHDPNRGTWPEVAREVHLGEGSVGETVQI
jgi:hypothetical protein